MTAVDPVELDRVLDRLGAAGDHRCASCGDALAGDAVGAIRLRGRTVQYCCHDPSCLEVFQEARPVVSQAEPFDNDGGNGNGHG